MEKEEEPTAHSLPHIKEVHKTLSRIFTYKFIAYTSCLLSIHTSVANTALVKMP